MWWRPRSQRLLKHLAPLSTYQHARSTGLRPACDDTAFHAKSQSTHNNWLSPTSPKDFQTYKNWHLKTLSGGMSQATTSADGRVDEPEPLFPPPKKGRLFGKSCTSDFVKHIPGNTLLTIVLNHYFELNFCRQHVYQRQSRIRDTCHLNKLPIVSTLQNCFSESPWKVSDRQRLNVRSGYTLNPLDINSWASLGLGVDPSAPRLFSEREFRMQGDLLWTSWPNGRALLLPLIRLPYPF